MAMSNRNRIVTEEELEKALDWLRDSAAEMGKCKERLVKAGHLVKHTEALLTLASSQSSADKRKAEALASERYLEKTTEEAVAAGEWEKMKALREAAALKIETWRSEQANYRALKV
jgi:rhamnose utilization protein RhaD (predicted bifunctional aldolase and dehydrogenase)